MKTKNIFRMLLVAAALLMGANNVKAGVEGQIWPANGADNTSDECSISKDVFINAGVSDGTVLRVYCGPITGGGGSFAIRFYANGQNPEFKAGYEATWETQVVTNNQGLINNSYIDLTCSANTATKLTTGGFSATVNGITIKNVAIVDGSSSGGGSTSTTDVVVWTGSVWSGKWGENGSRVFLDNNTFSSLKCDGKDVIRVYGTLGDIGFDDWGNAWFIQFLGGNWQPQGGWDCLNRSSNSTSDFTGYVDFKVTSEVASILKNNTNTNDGKCAILQGHNITFTSIVVNPSSTSSKTTPTLSFGEGAQETYNITYGDSFTGPTATCNIDGLEVTYTSSETSVAEVATYTGAVTIKKAGTTVITASTPETDDYEAASASYTLNIAKVNYTLSYSASTATAVLGQSWTAPTLNNPSGISVTYSSTNTGVATIDQNGNVTLVAAGETTIKANYTGDNNHEAKEASYVLTVSTASAPAKQDVTLTFSPSTATATMGEAFTAPTLTATANGETVTGLSISYSSSNTSVATVNASTGAVTLVAPGTTTITASFSGNDNYNAATASYTLTVNAAAPSDEDWIDVKDGNIEYYGYRTYVTPQAVDLSRSVNVEAYYATGLNSARTEVEFTQVTGVCASGVPLLLKATVTGASEYKLLKSSAAGATPTGNKLVGGARDNISGANKYVLTSHNGSVVFAEVNIEGATVDTEHAYLDLSGSNARGRLSIRLNGESTGISTIENDERTLDGAIYNLRGQRVENPTKGLYIINGKKVVIK